MCLRTNITPCFVATQEVPPEFTAMTGWPGCADCDIVYPLNKASEFRVRFDRTGVIASSIGDGWPNFLRQNKIGKGKFIIFEPADERTLVAMVYPPADTPEFTKTLRVSHSSPQNSAKLVRLPYLVGSQSPSVLIALVY